MKGSNWEAGHRMPFIVRWPGQVARGATSPQLVCFTDVLATLADLTQSPLPPEAGPDSFSFLPALLGRPAAGQPVRDSLVVGRSFRSGPWKLIEGREALFFGRAGSGTYPDKNEAPGQLYNLAEDPRETTNLAAAKPEIVARLKQELTRIQNAGRSRP
jgi:arylsulfatase A-like enzyme